MGAEMSYGIVTAILLGGTLMLGLALRRLLLRPIQALSLRAQELAEGGTAEPLEHYGTQELRDLGQGVLDMGQTLQAREISVRTYSDHITHELKSPLTAILGATEMLADGPLGESETRLLETVRRSGLRMENLLAGLSEFTATAEAHYGGLSRILDVLAKLESEFDTLDIECPDFETPINAKGLSIVLRHLLGNALAHGATRIVIAPSTKGFTVRDNGAGIHPDIAGQIFDPFFTTRREVGGTGMGLAIVARLLETLGGSIRSEACKTGACFALSLP